VRLCFGEEKVKTILSKHKEKREMVTGYRG
jgi:hypothetical protein